MLKVLLDGKKVLKQAFSMTHTLVNCEKIEDFRGNPNNAVCASGLLRHCVPRNDETHTLTADINGYLI